MAHNSVIQNALSSILRVNFMPESGNLPCEQGKSGGAAQPFAHAAAPLPAIRPKTRPDISPVPLA